MKNISQSTIKGKRVLIRVDFNVPLDNGLRITNDSRMIASLTTIKKIISGGGKTILMSHMGRPKDGFEEKFSLKHTVKHLSNLLEKPVHFSDDCIGKKTISDIEKMSNGDVMILENLRFYSEEKSGDEEFAKKLATFGDVYINDAFGTAHRNHASTAVIAKFFPNNKYFGSLMAKEISSLDKVLKNPVGPVTAIIGGSKISGKIDVIKSLFKKVNNLIIGGGMAYTFAKAMGGKIGKSLIEEDKVPLAIELIDEAKKNRVNLVLPSDSINADTFKNNAKTQVSSILSIQKDYMGLDIGEKSIACFSKIIKESKTIVWNGPMGVFEMQKFQNGTKMIGEAVCTATKRGAFSLVGGGDSVAAVEKFNLTDNISYISTGGGAMLKYLEGDLLPGIIAILD